MGSHAEPTEAQLKPLVENNHATWVFFTRAAALGVMATAAFVALVVFIITRGHA